MIRRLAMSLAVLAAGGWLCLACVVRPQQMNIVRYRVTQRSAAASAAIDLNRTRELASRNLEELEPFVRRGEGDAAILVLRAGNLLLLQRREEAIAAYRVALRRTQRPEIYLFLGLTELENGEHEAAIQDLARAARFAPSTLQRLDGEVATEVAARLSQR